MARVRAMSVWEKEAYLQELNNEMVGVAAELRELHKTKANVMRRMRLLRQLMRPTLQQPTIRGEFVRYRLGSVIRKKAYPTKESREQRWAIVNQLSHATYKYWFRLGIPIDIVDRLKARTDLKVKGYKHRALQTNDIYTLVQLLREKGVRLIHLRLSFKTKRGVRKNTVRNYEHYSIVRSTNGALSEELPELIPGWYTYIPVKQRQGSSISPSD